MSDGERFSLEVCGGTHVKATGQVGPLFVVGESSIGGGMRRIEAVTGRSAEQLFVERSSLLESLSRKLQTPVVDLETRLDAFIQDTDQLKKQLVSSGAGKSPKGSSRDPGARTGCGWHQGAGGPDLGQQCGGHEGDGRLAQGAAVQWGDRAG